MELLNKILSNSSKNLPLMAKLLTSLLVISCLYSLANITWLVLSPPTAVQKWQPPLVSQGQRATSTTDFSSFEWFGKANAKRVVVQQQVTDAPETRLNVILTGVMASDDPSRSIAIIEYQSQQATYIIDEKIQNTRATVSEIHPDRVILNNSGVFETLMLDGHSYDKQQVGASSTKLTAKPVVNKSRKFNNSLAKTRAEILKNPGKIIDYITISPVKAGGRIRGYRLNAGRQPELFRQSGLKANDLAVSINGYDLTDMAQSLQVMAQLKNMNDIMITVERNGQLTDIQFALPQ